MMKVLFIGGTGTISSAISRRLIEDGCELYLLNRGNRNDMLAGDIQQLIVDVNEEEKVKELIEELQFDVVADFIAFKPWQIERDYRIFKDKTKQFIYISSASAYEKPCSNYIISEETPLSNPYWEYSRDKIACEELLIQLYKEKGFPVTIVRPSHTYDERNVPIGVHGKNGSWQVLKRMLEGKPVIIHGDGNTLWTMTHNEDFAKGFIGLMGNQRAIGECFQITSDESLTWNQIYQTIADTLGVPLKPYYVSSDFLDRSSSYDFRGALLGDKANTVVFDNGKLKKLVPTYQATKPFCEGMKETISYILNHKECQIEDNEFDIWCDKVINVLENAIIDIKNI